MSNANTIVNTGSFSMYSSTTGHAGLRSFRLLGEILGWVSWSQVQEFPYVPKIIGVLSAAPVFVRCEAVTNYTILHWKIRWIFFIWHHGHLDLQVICLNCHGEMSVQTFRTVVTTQEVILPGKLCRKILHSMCRQRFPRTSYKVCFHQSIGCYNSRFTNESTPHPESRSGLHSGDHVRKDHPMLIQPF